MAAATITSDLEDEPCLACGTPMRTKVMPWSVECSTCGTWRSSLQPAIESRELHEPIDPEARISGFRELRVENNVRVLDEIAALLPLAGKHLIDVGSAHGWFLAEATRRGMRAEGIEPEPAMADYARAHRANVRVGYFPAVLAPDERVDVVAFNDVLEHIPDVEQAVVACSEILRPGGILSINVPTASGLAYRLAVTLARMRIRGPFLRLWQFGLPSPHVHYFTPAALTQLLQRHGFEVCRTIPLPSIRRSGLWARVHTVSTPSPLSILNFIALWLAAPILSRPSQSDIVLLLARR